jgi:beta-glucosidase
VSVLEGIREYAEGRFDVVYAEGCKITEEPGSWWRDANPSPNDLEEDARLVAEAVKVAQGADVTLLVLGGNESTCREAWSEEHLGDRDRLHLPGCQGSLVWSLTSLGKPLVALLLNGRPLTLEGVEEHLDALLEGWYLGQEGGRAFARVLFGEVNPGGKLTVTFPRSVGQLPAYYNHKPSRHRSYALTENGPLFPFGHGLSYTEFEYGPLTLAPEVISPDGEAVASVEVSNAGEVAGDEVVQLYVRDEVSSVTRPVMELRGFRRMALEPGESRTVSFRLGPEALRCYDREMRRVVEPGDFTIMVGASSADIRGRATLRVR